jgi:hypothetical protein
MTFNGRIATTLVMLAIFGGMSIIALGYPEKSRLLPLLVGVPATIMCLAQLVLDLRQAAAEGGVRIPLTGDARRERARETKMFGWLVAFFVGVLAFGFLYATPVLVAAYLRFAERESWPTAVLSGAAIWLVIEFIFARILEQYIFEGLVTAAIVRALSGTG